MLPQIGVFHGSHDSHMVHANDLMEPFRHILHQARHFVFMRDTILLHQSRKYGQGINSQEFNLRKSN